MIKKYFIITINLLAFIAILNSIEYPEYDLELVKTFKIGSGDGEVLIDLSLPGSTDGPTAFVFDKDSNLYISDCLNNRFVMFDNDFTFVKNYNESPLSGARYLYVDDNSNFISNLSYGVKVVDKSGELKVNINFRSNKKLKKQFRSSRFVYYNDIVCIYTQEGELFSIPKPTENNSENLTKILNEKETLSMLSSEMDQNSVVVRSSMINNEVVVDEKKRVLIDGDIAKARFKDFFNYKKEIREKAPKMNLSNNDESTKMKTKKHIESFTDEFLSQLKSMTFLGTDNDKNVYWKGGSMKVFVFSSSGYLINAFEYDFKKAGTPAVHPSGDVYFMNYDEKGVYLYRVKRVWGLEEE